MRKPLPLSRLETITPAKKETKSFAWSDVRMPSSSVLPEATRRSAHPHPTRPSALITVKSWKIPRNESAIMR